MRTQGQTAGRFRRRPEWQFFACLPRADPTLARLWWVVLVLRGLLPAGFAVAMGVLVGEVQHHRGTAPGLVAVGVVFVLLQALAPVHQALSANLGSRVAAWLFDRLTDACLAPPGLGHLEDPTLSGDLTVAREFDAGMTGPPMHLNVDFIAGGLVDLVSGLGGAVLLVGYRWWAPVVLGGAWLSTHWLLRESSVWRDRNTEEVREAQRHADYAYRLAVDPPAAKELRLFGLAGWVLDRFVERRRRLYELQYRATRLRERPVIVCLAIVGAANVVVFASMAHAATAGHLPLGRLVVFAQAAVGASLIAFGGLNWALDGAAAPVAAVLRLEPAMGPAGAVAVGSAGGVAVGSAGGVAVGSAGGVAVGSAGGVAVGSAGGVAVGSGGGVTVGSAGGVAVGAGGRAAPAGGAAAASVAAGQPAGAAASVAAGGRAVGIRFRGVGFAYPHTDHRVLDGLDLEVPAGSSLAVVGVNGAGKTTLAKLLCRFYDPTDGVIEVDGAELRSLDIGSWRSQVAAVFQDFVRFELPLRNNVAPAGAPDEVILAALADAGAGGLADLDTTLARGYPGGTDLSGGQWQRVALARALCSVRMGAQLVLLDEPTAQLDVRGEAAIFERVLAATRSVTTILISHRFSTVRHADRICVLERGRVAELGSHDELLSRGGRYRTMFELQARRFGSSLDEEGQAYDVLA